MRHYSTMALVLAAPGFFGAATAAQAQTSASQAENTTQIQEVVVTAQHRSEYVQKAAIPVSVVSSQALTSAGVTTPAELTRVVPALHISEQASSYAILNVRGIANFAVTPWSDPAVLVNYDGVPVASSAGTFGMFYDLERIEVLKGPQGTLYGRNATGGAINILPKRPQLGVFGGDISVELGNYNLKHVTGALNAPISLNAAVRGAFDIIHRDGYNSTGTGDNIGQAGRLQFRFEPTDALSIRIGGDYYHQGGRGHGSIPIHGQYLAGTHDPLQSSPPPLGSNYPGVLDPQVGQFINPSNPWTDINDPLVCANKSAYFPPPFPGAPPPSVCFNNSHLDNTFWGVNAEISYNFGFATLTVIPAYRRQSLDEVVHNSPDLHQIDEASQTSVEARLASNPDEHSPLKWVVGGFWIDNPDHGDFGVSLVPSLTTQLSGLARVSTTSWATFAQASYSILPWARITGGVRYTTDDKTFNVITRDNTGFIQPIPPHNLFDQHAKKRWTATTWKAGVEFDVARNSLLYFNVDRGYHSGGFYTTGAPNFSYEPEFVTAYTLGSKNQFLKRRLQINVEAFNYKYRGQQISHESASAFPVGGGQFALFPGFLTENIGQSTIWGVEADAAFKVTSTTLITADLQWERATYDSFILNSGVVPQTSGCAPLPPIPNGIPSPVFGFNYVVNCAGKPMIQAPALKFTFGLQQTVPLANGGSVVGAFNAYAQSPEWTAANYLYLPYQHVGSQWSGDMELTYNAPAGKWNVTAYVHNITNEANRTTSFGSGDVGLGLTQGSPPVTSLDPPRTYGVRVSAHF